LNKLRAVSNGRDESIDAPPQPSQLTTLLRAEV